MRIKSQIFKDIFSYGLSTYLSQGIGMISSIWVASQLGPENFGIYNAVIVVLGYAAYSELGALSAMGRDLPIFLGKNDLNNASAIEGAARYTTVIGAVIACLFIFTISFLPIFNIKMSFGLKVISVLILLQQIYTYQRMVLRSNNNFSELSQQQIIYSFVAAISALIFVKYSGYNGRLYATLISQLVILFYSLNRNPLSKVPKFNFKYSYKIVKIGIPILASGFIISLLTSIDRLMIITFINATQLGYYGLSVMLVSIISMIPAMASQVLFPRINFHYGKSGYDIQKLRLYVLKPPLVLSAILPFVIGPIYLILPLAVKMFLPKYIEGIESSRIVSLGIFFYGILGLTDYFLITIGKLKMYALFGTIALVFNICIDFLLIKMGFGIIGVAFGGTLVTYFFYSTIVIGYASSFYNKNFKVWIMFFVKLWGPFLYMVLLLYFVEFVGTNLLSSYMQISPIKIVALNVFIFFLACIPLKFIIESELKLDLSIRHIVRYFRS